MFSGEEFVYEHMVVVSYVDIKNGKIYYAGHTPHKLNSDLDKYIEQNAGKKCVYVIHVEYPA